MANRDLIAIGGSSGALAPLRDILGRLPADLPAAVLVVLHMPARGAGVLSAVTPPSGRLPVCRAEDGMVVERGRIYVGPPDRHLMVEGERIRLGRGPQENMARPAVDALFRSAAVAFGPRAIGVVLSGLMSDGAAGLGAIKRCGGLTMVQDPADAVADEMPRRALRGGEVDFCVVSAGIAGALAELARGDAGPAPPVPPEMLVEVAIAMGDPIDPRRLSAIAEPVALTCPACGGVLSQMRGGGLRFRCQVGHGYSADALADQQEGRVDEALRVALRIIEERVELVQRMAEDGRASGRFAVADLYAARADEYRRHADTIRRAVLRSLDDAGAGDP